ncbi:MAG TPA: hypothetical protein VGP17_07000 [Solirubrobacteraceae bacterium]|jgi:hypothetical protein|nr:hypothetical protein [Solirubrobacteraceae bacterium]
MIEQADGASDPRNVPLPADHRALDSRRHKVALLALRVGLPLALLLIGLVILIAGETQLGLILVGIAGMSVIVDVYARQSIDSSDDREREEQARRTFSETGRWPSARGPR